MKNFIFVLVFIFLLSASYPACSAQAGSASEIEALFMAKKAYADGFYEVTLEMLERFRNSFPHSSKTAEVKVLTAQCYFYQGRYLEALNILEGLLQDPAAKDFLDAIDFWMAEVHFKGNNFKQAAGFYRSVVSDFPQSSFVPAAYYSLGWSLFQLGEYTQAMQSFQALLDKFPNEPQAKDASFKIIECLYNLKEYASLSSKVRPYLKLYGQDPLRLSYLYFYLAESDYYLGNFQEAARNYVKVSQLAADEKIGGLAKLGLAWAYLKLNKYKEADEAFAEVTPSFLDKKSLDIFLLGKAVSAGASNLIYEAKNIYDQLITASRDPLMLAQAFLGKADALYNLAEYAQAAQVYKEGLSRLERETVPAELTDKLHGNLSLVYIKEGEYKSAIAELKYLTASSNNQEVKAGTLSQIGDAYQDSGEYASAAEVYASILKEHPGYSACDYAQYQLAAVQFKQGDLGQAILSFQQLPNNYPQSKLLDEAAYSLALAYFQKEDYPAACNVLERFQHEFAHSPLSGQALYLLGSCFINLSKFREALNLFKDISKRYPQDSELLQKAEYQIADCYYRLGEEKEAISRFNLLRTKYPDARFTPEILLWLGQYYYQHDDLHLAKRYFSSLTEDFPDSRLAGDAFYTLGLIFSDEDKLTQAADSFKRAVKIGSPELKKQAAVAIGDTYYRASQFEEALARYKETLKENQDLGNLLFPRLAEVSYKIGDYSAAKSFYTRAIQLSTPQDVAGLKFGLAEALEANSEPDAAIQQYLAAADLYTEPHQLVRALLRAAKLYEDREESKEALKIYRRVITKNTLESGFAQERIDLITAGIKTSGSRD